MKRADGRGTLLQYAVRFVADSEDEAMYGDVLSFSKELSGVQDALAVRTPARGTGARAMGCSAEARVIGCVGGGCLEERFREIASGSGSVREGSVQSL
jgi:hypothetical protein